MKPMTEQSEYTTRVTYLITRTHVYEVAADQDELNELEPLTETETPPEIGHERRTEMNTEIKSRKHAEWSAEHSAIACALMRIEGDAA